MTTAVRGLFFILAVIVALILALATPLGELLDELQTGLLDGWYSPKLTMLLVVVGVSVFVMPLSLLAERAAAQKLRARLSEL